MKKGFTLIEVMIVVVIAVSVAAFAVPAYKKSQEQNRFLAAEGKLLEISSGLHNVIQMDKGTSCSGSPTASDKNGDGTLNKEGCRKYPHECLFTNDYIKTTMSGMHGYSYSIATNCDVCMQKASNSNSPVPYKVCVNRFGVETLTYPGGVTSTRGN